MTQLVQVNYRLFYEGGLKLNLYDDENKIIEYFQKTPISSVYFPKMLNELEEIFDKIYFEENWLQWKDSSDKDNPPPDFYSDEFGLMMDVMRIDDHAFVSKKGKVVNLINAGESKLRKELENSGIMEQFPNCKNIFVTAKTKLPTEEDHNYDFYLSNFERTVKEHIRKIPLYKQNHPNCKIVFFVFDESSAYMKTETDSIRKQIHFEREGINALPHIHFLDKSFLNVVSNTKIDYLIWFSPFKLTMGEQGIIDMPIVGVFKINDLDFETFIYEADYMLSTEV